MEKLFSGIKVALVNTHGKCSVQENFLEEKKLENIDQLSNNKLCSTNNLPHEI